MTVIVAYLVGIAGGTAIGAAAYATCWTARHCRRTTQPTPECSIWWGDDPICHHCIQPLGHPSLHECACGDVEIP